ncbi:phosphate signaling complex protein PhoU [Phycisphaerales bacterium AB-hyl4]|uniref:Phosphate-specific transport system accessory protein PhoU n=1 Tax=Natronomicrosphaera hydrolytica TaxID=3242702 RepID=A0ABV4UB60_9BACT
MSAHLHKQILRLKQMIVDLGTQVDVAVQHALQAVHERDPELAREVVAGDERIDMLEVEIEEECLHALALHQPVALDLRYVIAMLKINNDLERIGDLAVNIADQAIFLSGESEVVLPFNLEGMGDGVSRMLQQARAALLDLDVKQAERVRLEDDKIDAIHRDMYRQVEQAIREQPTNTEQYIHMLNVSRHLERIGDHAVNIAEDVIYMARGEIMRHRQPPAEESVSGV